MKKLKCNKRKEDEGDECKNELTKSKKEELREEWRKDSVKGYEKNDNLRVRIKSKNAKSGHN